MSLLVIHVKNNIQATTIYNESDIRKSQEASYYINKDIYINIPILTGVK